MSMAIDICFVVVRFCRNMKTNILPVIGISILGQAQAYSKLVCVQRTLQNANLIIKLAVYLLSNGVLCGPKKKAITRIKPRMSNNKPRLITSGSKE